jgi:hypothetical protein
MEGEGISEVVGSGPDSDSTCATSKVFKSASGSGSPVFELAPELLSFGCFIVFNFLF